MEKLTKVALVQRLFSKIIVSLAQLAIVLIPALISFILGYILCGVFLSLMPPLGIIYLALSFLVFGGVVGGIIFFFFMRWFKKTNLYKKVEDRQGII